VPALLAVTRRVFPELIQALESEFRVVHNQDDRVLDAAALREFLADADAVLTNPADRVDATLLSAAPRLKIAANVAVGYNNLDLVACTAAGVLASNTPDVLTESTADHAWALLLAAARRVGESERWLRAGQWKRNTFEMFLGAEVHGTTLGVLGLGRIGRAIARRAAGFGMSVNYHNRQRLAPELEGGARYVGFEELLATSDHLVIVLPYSPAVHHLIGAEQLAHMKPGAVLVNIARGGVVDDAALAAALAAGRLGAAGLDVFENEPALTPALLECDRAVLTPHIASATHGTRQAMAQRAIANARAALAGERPPDLLNPEAWENRRRP
jgi:lactate dehydrogenase-like 2-hydroxyacid dehydrogenase